MIAIVVSMAAASASPTAVPVPPNTPVATSPGAGAASRQDPVKADRVICEEEDAIGTRLGSARICKRASQWAAERRADQATIERGQLVGSQTREPR
jgi:hypothetical protein